LKLPRVLIVGDSFAAKIQEYTQTRGWPELLADFFNVDNYAQAGCSEYRIWQQLVQVDLGKFDCVLVSHTSPYRVTIRQHPIHKNGLHQNCDAIYEDVKSHGVETLVDFFENYFDMDYAQHMHELIGQAIEKHLQSIPAIHMYHVEKNLPHQYQHIMDFSDLWKKHRGTVNHYSNDGNQIILAQVCRKIEELI
jgi:hypothetical protein